MNPKLPFTDLPEGTITFLFTDIEGSTQLLGRLRNRYATLLYDHRRILREAFTNWNGHEVSTQGDSFFIAFPRARDAVAAAVEAQRALAQNQWPEGAAIQVRMGLHTGEPWVEDKDYIGMDIHRAARITHVGHGGQVLLSETTAALVRDELPEGVSLLDLGRHQLKDMISPEHIRQLVIKDLPSKFSPLKSLEALPPERLDEPRVVRPAVIQEEEMVTEPGPVFVTRERKMDDEGEVAVSNKLKITSFGGLSINIGDERVTGFASRKVEALLVYLACNRRVYAREVLADMLWEERTQSQALSNMRVALSSLRKEVGDYVTITRDSVGINPNAEVWLDVAGFEKKFENGQIEEAVALYQGEFLHSFYLRGAAQFEEWVMEERARLHNIVVTALHKLLDAALKEGSWDVGLTFARQLVRLEPLDEAAHRKLMLLLAYSDQRSAALAHYEKWGKLLEKELGVTPEKETTGLFEQIQSGELKFSAPATIPTPVVGIEAQIPAFLEMEAKVEPVERPPFVARERELERLHASLARAVDGEGHVVFITGGPGRGKSSLLEEFTYQAWEQYAGLLAVSGNCNAYSGIGDPYMPFREIMGALSGDVEARWRAGTINREHAGCLWDCLPLTIQALINKGPDLLDVLLPGKALLSRARVAVPESGSLLQQLDELVERQYERTEGLEQRRLFQQFANVLHEIAGTCPLLLVLDDMQWADTASISLLFHLGRQLQGSSILIACAYRPEEVASGRAGERHPLEKVLGEFKRHFGDVWINLGQTEETQGQDFVDAYLDTQPNRLGEDFREALLQHTGGHPLFTIELLRAMQERGDLVQERGAWIDKPSLNWNMLPARIEGVIEERIGALDDELLEILNIACVEGEDFNAQIIARMQNTSEIKVLSRLSKELEHRHHLVREIGEVDAGGNLLSRFKFSHMLIHRYLYNHLGTGERRLMHAEIGSILEDLYAGQTEDIAVQLTHHFQEAGIPERALPYMIHAGDKARSLYANAEAEMYYKRAATIQQKQGRNEEAARTLLKLGLVYTAAYESEKAQESYNQAFNLWDPLRESTDLLDLRAPTAVLRFALEEPRTLDPGVAEDDVSALLVAQLFEGLVRIGRDYNILPAVAARWEVNEEGTKYVFHIKEDVHWNDGTQLTAADFEYAWKRNLSLTEESPATSLLHVIKNAQAFKEGELDDPSQVGVHARNDFTLEVCLEDPTPYFPYLLAHTVLYPLPKWALERYGSDWAQYQNLVTNGPYELAEWKPGERLTLSKNPLYHEEFSGNVQKVECLVFESFNEQTLKVYDSDNLDAVSLLNADPGALAQAMNTHPDEFVTIPRPSTLYLSFRTDIPPFDDVRLRRAFVHAVDRDELESKAYKGSHMAATGGFIPPGMVGHSAGIGLVYDPDLARRLLSEAGYPNGKGFPEIAWLHPTASKDERIIPFLRSSWRENLGLELESQSPEWGEFYQRFTSDPAHLTILGWGADYPDPDNMLRVTFHSEEGLNIPHWHNSRFDTLVETAKRITDQGNRMELYREADRILVAEEAVIMPLGYANGWMLVKPWVSLPRTLSVQMSFNRFVVDRDRL